jgi:hypothetical protein
MLNPKVHYYVDKSLPLLPILSHKIQSISPIPISLRPILILAFHLQLDLPSGTIPRDLRFRILYESLLPHMGQISIAETIYKMHIDIGDICQQKGQAFGITPLHNKTQNLPAVSRLKTEHLELCWFTHSRDTARYISCHR